LKPASRCWITHRFEHAARIPQRLRARDLAALNVTAPLGCVSARERMRFLQVYAGGADRALARRIARRVAHLLRRRRFQDFSETASRR